MLLANTHLQLRLEREHLSSLSIKRSLRHTQLGSSSLQVHDLLLLQQ